jgi:hypothetical protein
LNASRCYGWTLAEHRKQFWKAIIATQNWGVIGGLGTWGWVSIQGLDKVARDLNSNEALEDDIKAGSELMALEHVLLEPIDDSSQLGWGTVLDGAPTSSITLPTATCTGYTDPIRALGKVMDNGDQYIFATNKCKDTQTMTFSLANKPPNAVAQDVLTGEILTIDGEDDIDVSSTDFDVHVIKISTPEGGEIEPR